MSRRSRGKTRFERRKAHAILTKGRPGLIAAPVVAADIVSPTVAEVKESVQHHALSAVPTRAPCPECGYSQKVKRDGTMGTHPASQTIDAKTCPGTGKRYNA